MVKVYCDDVLNEEQNNVKGLYRRALAHSKKKDWAEAVRDLKKLLATDEKNLQARKLLQHVSAQQKKYDTSQKAMFNKPNFLEG